MGKSISLQVRNPRVLENFPNTYSTVKLKLWNRLKDLLCEGAGRTTSLQTGIPVASLIASFSPELASVELCIIYITVRT